LAASLSAAPFNGRYPFTRPVLDRPLRDPNATDDEGI
jgi:hypothetical protein